LSFNASGAPPFRGPPRIAKKPVKSTGPIKNYPRGIDLILPFVHGGQKSYATRRVPENKGGRIPDKKDRYAGGYVGQ
jgi:hypothetical protein